MTAGTRPRVLVVEDERAIRSLTERVLRGGGYDVIAVGSAADALHLIDQQPRFDLFVLDLMMPHMRGDELATQLRLRDPDARILYFTGYSDRLFSEKQTLWANEAFLEKPVSNTGLLQAVSLLLFGHTAGPKD